MGGSGPDLSDAETVCGLLLAGARANLESPCRQGSIDVISAPGTLIATGDLHDNPMHLRVLEGAWRRADQGHLVLHELIHSERLVGGMDLSHRALARVARLKAEHPEGVHALLANHELAQVAGAGIVKNGVRMVEAFDAGVAYVFGDGAARVREGIEAFIRSMPLALRCRTRRGDILCAHSLPNPAMMGRFDTSVLSRDLTREDYEPLRGAAHQMVWGRGYDAEQLEDLVEGWGVYLFLLGHEHVAEGVRFVPPCAVVLNSDHEGGVYVPIDLSDPPEPAGVAELARRLREDEGWWRNPGGSAR